MLDNVTEFNIRNGLTASHDIKQGNNTIIFRIIDKNSAKWKTLAVANISEHQIFGVQECYTEAVMLKDGVTVDDFRVLYQSLKYHLTWYKHKFDGRLHAYVIDQTYFKNRYGSRAALTRRAKKLNEYKR